MNAGISMSSFIFRNSVTVLFLFVLTLACARPAVAARCGAFEEISIAVCLLTYKFLLVVYA